MPYLADEPNFKHDMEPSLRFCRRCYCTGAAAFDGRVPRCGVRVPDGAFYVEPKATGSLALGRSTVARGRARLDGRLLEGMNH